jgi:hypothetical protein
MEHAGSPTHATKQTEHQYTIDFIEDDETTHPIRHIHRFKRLRSALIDGLPTFGTPLSTLWMFVGRGRGQRKAAFTLGEEWLGAMSIRGEEGGENPH